MDEQLRSALREAVSLHQSGRFEEAAERYRNVLEADPENPFALQLLGTLQAQQGRYDDAVELFDRAIARKPDYPDAHNNRGSALKALGRVGEALQSVERALALDPAYADAHNNRGALLHELGRPGEAIASFDRALQLQPRFTQALSNRADALRAAGRREEALAAYEEAIALEPGKAELHYNRGNVLAALERSEEALESYDRAIAVAPRHASAHNNRGVVLAKLRRFDEALGSYDIALQCLPAFSKAHNNRGNALRDLRRLQEALASYERALQLQPDYADAHYNRGLLFEELKRLDEAVESYGRALQLAPDYPYLRGTWLLARMQVCDWTDYDVELRRLADGVRSGAKAGPPFPVMTLIDDPALQRLASETWVQDKHPGSASLGDIARRAPSRRIRLGYYSADFHEHASTYLMAEMFEKHDPARFELVAFSFGPEKVDSMRRRVAAAFDEFIDVQARSEREIAALSRQKQIDIAVDLKGFTRDSRGAIFSYRAAPIQVAYMGFPSSSGAPYIDYLVADDTVIPPESRQSYLENIVWLPGSYMVNDSQRRIAEATPSRAELGLPPGGFVFCSFNNSFKITPGVLDSWTRILRAVEGSVLWLLEDNPWAARNLRSEAERRGVRGNRIVFAPRLPLAEHLARHRAADLFLDTLPCNAHTTASDALWAGLPVLTRKGKSFAGRIAASVVYAVDLPELVVDSEQAYEARAIELARSPARLRELKARLAQNRLTAPLFDGAAFTRHLQAAYQRMYERYQAGLAPADIRIEDA
ncbi:MAG TPA: tetratricopeptide repeat protein [Burkholderiales bacterium]|nr:tetratricopeptide repeat protein [Burkholderiales bacterium]